MMSTRLLFTCGNTAVRDTSENIMKLFFLCLPSIVQVQSQLHELDFVVPFC